MNTSSRRPLAGLAVLLMSSPLLADPPLFSDYYSDHFSEPAVVFNSTSLAGDELPLIITRPHFPAVFRNDINLHCIALRGLKDTLLVYLPQSETCARLDDLHRTQGHRRTPGLKRRPGFEPEFQELNTRLQSGLLVTIKPQGPMPVVAAVCSCDGNLAPEVGVTAGQDLAVTAGAPVQIDFAATDADSEVLMDTFTWQLDGGDSQPDLPAGLVKNCTAGSGTLDCSVSGTAPGVIGVYAIRLEVSDGLASGFATALLTVFHENIFSDGFEENP